MFFKGKSVPDYMPLATGKCNLAVKMRNNEIPSFTEISGSSWVLGGSEKKKNEPKKTQNFL